MAFKLPKKFSPGFSTNKKPTCLVEIDWSHPITKDLVMCQVGFQADLVSGYVPKKFESYRDKNYLVHNSVISKTELEQGSDSIMGTEEVSVALGYEKRDSTNRGATAFGFDSDSGEKVRCNCHLPYSDGTVYFDFGDWENGRVTASGLTFGDDNWVFVASKDTYVQPYRLIYQNGVEKALAVSLSPDRQRASYPFLLGKSSSDLANYKYIYVFNRVLSPREIKSLNDEPYQFFKPSIDTIYFPDTTESTGGIDINVPKSDINLTSFQPIVNISQHITAEIPRHDLNLLSHTPSVDIGANIDVIAPQHNISINSYPPAVVTSNNINIDIPVHDINLLSYAPSIVTSESIDLDIPLHNININSYAPIAVASNFIDAEIPDHNININSHAPVISLGAIIENIIPAHNINITGYAPDVAISEHINSIIPEHNISLLSYAPEVLANSSVNAIIPKNDITITSHIPRVLIAGAFTTAKERIYGYPAINRIYTMTRR